MGNRNKGSGGPSFYTLPNLAFKKEFLALKFVATQGGGPPRDDDDNEVPSDVRPFATRSQIVLNFPGLLTTDLHVTSATTTATAP